MPYNETLADRVREALAGQRRVAEKNMMGGLTFMVNNNPSATSRLEKQSGLRSG